MKKYKWNPVCDGETHSVILCFNRLTGKTFVSVDGSRYDISCSPFRYFTERRELFRLAEDKQAILVIPAFGTPDIVVDRKFVGSGKPYVS